VTTGVYEHLLADTFLDDALEVFLTSRVLPGVLPGGDAESAETAESL
jgi:hypothetical protein